MPASLIPLRRVIALILLAAVAIICMSLGNWQLERAAEREAVHAAIVAGRQQTPLTLSPTTPPEEFRDWRPARATGHWLNEYTVLVMNRNLKGVSGYWVATPLQLEPDQKDAVLVLRGWLARPLRPGESLPAFDAPPGVSSVEGQLVSRVPRLYELPGQRTDARALLASAFQGGQPAPEVQNLALDDLAAATGLKLLPVVLEETPSNGQPNGDALIREWPLPSTDADQNRGYAIQWFGFATIATIAWLMVAWHTVRRRSETSDTTTSQ